MNLADTRTGRSPLALTRTQYLQAKSSIEQYENDHNIDAEHQEGSKPAAQRAAISQKLFVGLRKPPAMVDRQEMSEVDSGWWVGRKQLATSE